ncbi:hypothetical protein QTO34_004258, partial [Cnephaeus nilssonii]
MWIPKRNIKLQHGSEGGTGQVHEDLAPGATPYSSRQSTTPATESSSPKQPTEDKEWEENKTNSPEVTWGMVKKMVQKAERICEETRTPRTPRTPENVFLALLAVISNAVILPGQMGKYIGLMFLTLHGIVTNNTKHLGHPGGLWVGQGSIWAKYNYKGVATHLPFCMTESNYCSFPLCKKFYEWHPTGEEINWQDCYSDHPTSSKLNNSFSFVDWSPYGSAYSNNHTLKWKGAASYHYVEANHSISWYGGGFVGSQFQHDNWPLQNTQWKLAAAPAPIKWYSFNYSSDNSIYTLWGTPNKTVFATACVFDPFVLLSGPIQMCLNAISHLYEFVQEVKKNVTKTCPYKKRIDSKFDVELLALKSTVLWMGDKIHSLEQRMSLQCHYNFSQICVTPIPYNSTSHPWESIKKITFLVLGVKVLNPSRVGCGFTYNLKQRSGVH